MLGRCVLDLVEGSGLEPLTEPAPDTAGGTKYLPLKEAKGIGRNEDLLDRAGHVALAANYFRITQTEQRLQRDGVRDEHTANSTHHRVGQQVRETMKSISGTVPEKLPAEPSLKKLKSKRKPKRINGAV